MNDIRPMQCSLCRLWSHVTVIGVQCVHDLLHSDRHKAEYRMWCLLGVYFGASYIADRAVCMVRFVSTGLYGPRYGSYCVWSVLHCNVCSVVRFMWSVVADM